MSPTDLVLAIAIVAAALAVLHRSFRRSGGPCAGCSGGGCASKRPSGGGCSVPAPREQVVTLTRPRRS